MLAGSAALGQCDLFQRLGDSERDARARTFNCRTQPARNRRTGNPMAHPHAERVGSRVERSLAIPAGHACGS
jgi:hypothetical protein